MHAQQMSDVELRRHANDLRRTIAELEAGELTEERLEKLVPLCAEMVAVHRERLARSVKRHERHIEQLRVMRLRAEMELAQ